MKAFGRYESYKNSSVEWVGDIPSHWEARKLKFCSNIHNGSTPSSTNAEYWNGNIVWITPKDISGANELYSSLQKITEAGYQNCGATMVPVESIVLTTRAPIGNIAIAKVELCTNQGCKSIVVNELNNSKFIYYILSIRQEILQSLGTGTTFLELSTYSLKSFEIPLPSLEEQRQIVDFLDVKSKQVDEFIADKQALITLFEEQKSAIINDAVTKGLDKTAPLKPSGIEWVGDIPSHWEVKKLKYSIQIKSGIGITANELKEDGLYKVYGGNGDIGFYDKFNTVDEVLIIGRVGAKCGNVHHVNEKIWVSDNALIVETIENYAFMYYLLSSLNLNKLSTSTAQPLITGSDIKNYTVVLPPLEEQKQIVAYLETELAKIDTLIDTAKAEIALIEEYKTSLINEAVAGKIKIYNGANT